MNKKVKERVTKEADCMIKTNQTIREIANYYRVSKSTVHKDLKDRLKWINKDLEVEVKEILKHHKDERHLRGGESTKRKFLELKNQK